jgi:hypothetical protein
MVSYGLTAGLKRNEIDRMKPGEIMDLYYYRQEHDLMVNGFGLK